MGLLHSILTDRRRPGRGARPEVLFNLNLSGPPALFFVYHVHPLVKIFGPAAWVESGACYDGLQENGGYLRFADTLTVGFRGGGLGQWTWAGGVEIREAEEVQRILLTGGALVRKGGTWTLSTGSGEEALPMPDGGSQTLEAQFMDDIRTGAGTWRQDAQLAIAAARIGIAAEQSAGENRRILLGD